MSSFYAYFNNWCLSFLLCNHPQVIVIWSHWWQVNIDSGNGLGPTGNTPLPEAMLTQIYVATMSHNELMGICHHFSDTASGNLLFCRCFDGYWCSYPELAYWLSTMSRSWSFQDGIWSNRNICLYISLFIYDTRLHHCNHCIYNKLTLNCIAIYLLIYFVGDEDLFNWHSLHEIRAWKSNHIQYCMWDVVTHLCPYFSTALLKHHWS